MVGFLVYLLFIAMWQIPPKLICLKQPLLFCLCVRNSEQARFALQCLGPICWGLGSLKGRAHSQLGNPGYRLEYLHTLHSMGSESQVSSLRAKGRINTHCLYFLAREAEQCHFFHFFGQPRLLQKPAQSWEQTETHLLRESHFLLWGKQTRGEGSVQPSWEDTVSPHYLSFNFLTCFPFGL